MDQVLFNQNVRDAGRHQELTTIHHHRTVQTLSIWKIGMKCEFVVNIVRFNHPYSARDGPRRNGCMSRPNVDAVENFIQRPCKCRIDHSKGAEPEKFRSHHGRVPIVGSHSLQHEMFLPYFLGSAALVKTSSEGQNRKFLVKSKATLPHQRSEAIEYIHTQRSHESHGYEDPQKEKREAQAKNATLTSPVKVE